MREKLFGELQMEKGYYESNKKMLERLKKLRRAQMKATREMHGVYLASKKQHKKLTASAQERIKNLTELEKDAKKEEQRTIKTRRLKTVRRLGSSRRRNCLDTNVKCRNAVLLSREAGKNSSNA